MPSYTSNCNHVRTFQVPPPRAKEEMGQEEALDTAAGDEVASCTALPRGVFPHAAYIFIILEVVTIFSYHIYIIITIYIYIIELHCTQFITYRAASCRMRPICIYTFCIGLLPPARPIQIHLLQ